MRAYGISVGILAAILVFSLWNSSYMTASTVRWREPAAAGGRPSPSQRPGPRPWIRWQAAMTTGRKAKTYLHIVARHDTVDDAEAMYRRALAFAATRELTEFRAEISDLRDQLRLLAETERLDIKNVL